MSLKFKVGDKVRIVNYLPAIDGQVGTVSLVRQNGSYPYMVDGPFFDEDGKEHKYITYAAERELELAVAPKVTPKPTLATAVGLQPQTRKILNHLEKRGSISPMEALTAYGCFRLAAQVHNLRKAGYDVKTDIKEDEVGHRYARYYLAA